MRIENGGNLLIERKILDFLHQSNQTISSEAQSKTKVEFFCLKPIPERFCNFIALKFLTCKDNLPYPKIWLLSLINSERYVRFEF